MPAIYVANHITLDGVIQAPGRADEDTRHGFAHGGWSVAGMNDEVAAALAERVTQAGGMRLLLGHRSYSDMLAYWNTQDSPFRDGLNQAQKHVASRNPSAQLPWPNSTLISGDVVDAVRRLKAAPGADLCVMGSGELMQALLQRRLIDELLLFVHPLLLGRGQRLFSPDGAPARLEQLRCTPTGTGVTIMHYRVVDAV